MSLTKKNIDEVYARAGAIMDALHPLGVGVLREPTIDAACIFNCPLSTGDNLEIDGDTAYLVRDGVRTRPWKDGEPMPAGWRPGEAT